MGDKDVTIIAQDILGILSAGTVEGNIFRLTCGQLDRKTYEAVNKALDILGGKWNRKAGGHVFPFAAAEIIDQAILTGEVGKRNPLEFFETPPALARQLVEMAQLEAHHRILEPSAGLGSIIDAVPEELRSRVVMIESDPQRRIYLQGKYGRPCAHDDFLTYQPDAPFDRAVMNPPFSKGQECRHVARSFDMLAEGGRLVSIMSNSVTFRRDDRYSAMRNLIDRAGYYIPNPDGAFKGSGTGVNTITVLLDK